MMRPPFLTLANPRAEKGSPGAYPAGREATKDATQDHPDGAWKEDGAELNQVKIVGGGGRGPGRSAA
jgi:hypothetical protein